MQADIIDNYIVFIITSFSDQAGIVGVWDCDKKAIIHISEGTFALHALYLVERCGFSTSRIVIMLLLNYWFLLFRLASLIQNAKGTVQFSVQ